MASAPVRNPLGLTIDQFDRWIAGAALGERLVYAEGLSPPRHLPVWNHARDAAGEGIVRLHNIRSGERQWWHFVAVRVAPAVPSVVPVPAAVVAIDLDDPTETVFRALRRAVNFALPCPTNAHLAQICGLKDAAAASYRLRVLRDLNRIRISDNGPGNPRVVTIVASGRSTAAGGIA